MILTTKLYFFIQFQINGEENTIIKIPKFDFEKLDKARAIQMALQQKQLQDILNEQHIINVQYTWHSDYQSVVNFITPRIPKKTAAKGG